MLRISFPAVLVAAVCLALAGCSGTEAKRIAAEAARGTLRSACADADNCTQDCDGDARVPQGAKCAEKP